MRAAVCYTKIDTKTLLDLFAGLQRSEIEPAHIVAHSDPKVTPRRTSYQIIYTPTYPSAKSNNNLNFAYNRYSQLNEHGLVNTELSARSTPNPLPLHELELLTLYHLTIAHQISDATDITLCLDGCETPISYYLHQIAVLDGKDTYVVNRQMSGRHRIVVKNININISGKHGGHQENIVRFGSSRRLYPYTDALEKYAKTLSQSRQYDPSYMRRQKKQEADYLRAGLLSQFLLRCANTICDRVMGDKSRIDVGRIETERYYSLLSESKIDGRFSPTVYFPLHYQPELTNMPWGGAHQNQFRLATMIARALPLGGMIYIKEHPSSFSRSMKFRRSFRSKGMYALCNSHEKLNLLSTRSPNIESIRRADFTATLTGTAGVEALVLGENPIVFGNAWYANAPGAFNCFIPQLNCSMSHEDHIRHIRENILSSTVSSDRTLGEFLEYSYNFESHTFIPDMAGDDCPAEHDKDGLALSVNALCAALREA